MSGTAVGGDLTGTLVNPTLAAIGSATGPTGGTTAIPVVTIDAKGRVTALTSAAVTSATCVQLFTSTVTGADAASIDTGAAGIAGGYSMLDIWLYLRTDEAVAGSGVALIFNNDASSIYDRKYNTSTNASTLNGVSLASSSVFVNAAGASCATGVFGHYRCTIPAYASTVGQKPMTLSGGIADTTAANCFATLEAYNYRSTAAISRLGLTVVTGGKKFKVGSQVTVYGLL